MIGVFVFFCDFVFPRPLVGSAQGITAASSALVDISSEPVSVNHVLFFIFQTLVHLTHLTRILLSLSLSLTLTTVSHDQFVLLTHTLLS